MMRVFMPQPESHILSFAAFQHAVKLHMNINIEVVDGAIDHAMDLTDPSLCLGILKKFSAKVQAKNLTCAGSMFIKYWMVPLLYPYWYSALIQQVNLPWSLDQIVLDLPEKWQWDRSLVLDQSGQKKLQTLDELAHFDTYFLKILTELNLIFKVISQVAKVPHALLWENTALRVLQFYDTVQRKQYLSDSTHKDQHYQFLMSLPENEFGLKYNPFLALAKTWDGNLKRYARQKCCFYFQLPEASHEYCSGCPLLEREKTRDKIICKII